MATGAEPPRSESSAPPLAISTAYFTLRTPELAGDEIGRQVRELGFRAVEVDYRLTEPQLRALLGSAGGGGIEIVSVHHPFPRTDGRDPATAHLRGPWLTSLDREERRAATRLGLEGVIRAADLGARAVVLHLGQVELPGETDARVLEAMLRRGDGDSARFVALREELVALRSRWARPHLDALLSALDSLAGAALREGLRLGLENRYHPEEIPDGEELAEIFRVLEGAPLGYWHDTGHAHSLYLQGFLSARVELLERFRDRVLGFHLHDARGLDDHRAPGEGELDFRELAPYAGRAVKVLEVHPAAAVVALVRAPTLLRQAGLG